MYLIDANVSSRISRYLVGLDFSVLSTSDTPQDSVLLPRWKQCLEGILYRLGLDLLLLFVALVCPSSQRVPVCESIMMSQQHSLCLFRSSDSFDGALF